MSALAVYVAAQNPNSFEKDGPSPSYPQYKAEQAARNFLEQFPNSDHAPIVRQYLKDIREMIALRDLQVAQFYASRANYAGAKRCLREIIF